MEVLSRPSDAIYQSFSLVSASVKDQIDSNQIDSNQIKPNQTKSRMRPLQPASSMAMLLYYHQIRHPCDAERECPALLSRSQPRAS